MIKYITGFCVWIIVMWLAIMSTGCAIKPKFLIEESLQQEAKKELDARQAEWNWKNRHRVRQEREFWEKRLDILPQQGIAKKQQIRRMRQYRNPQLGIGRNTYNPNKSGQRKHITPKRYNGIAVHKKNYWSKTTKYPQEENK